MERAYENKGPVIIYRLAGSGGFGAKLRWNLADPPFECYFTEVPPPPPPKNVWWLSRSPTTSSFSKQTWVVPPLNPSKVLSDSPFWVLCNGWPPFCSPKNQVIPLKSSPRPHLQMINNERSLKTAVDLLTANFARALVDFSKENGNDVCVRATKIKKRGRETDQVFT